MTLFQKYLNSVAMFEAPNDKGSSYQPAKPKIEVESVDNREDKTPAAGDELNDKDENENEDDEQNEDTENNEKNKEIPGETEEQKTARITQEKEDRRQGRIQKRIDKLTATVGAKDNEITELKKQLAEKPKEGLTEEEIERRATALADAKLKDKEAKEAEANLKKAVDKLVDDANKVDKEFQKKINAVSEETGAKMPTYMVDILTELDNENGHEILNQLANDADLFEEVCALPERKMTQRLIRMSDKIKEAKDKEKNKKASRLPDPIETVDGNNNRGNSLPAKPTQNMDEFVRVRAKQTEEFRKSRGR